MSGKVIKVAGPLVVAEGLSDANVSDVVRVGPQQLIGEILFLDLALDPILSRLICPVCEDIVLDQLLRDRAGAFGKVEPACQPDIGGAENARDVDPAVLVETFVLDGDKGIGKIAESKKIESVGIGI